MSYAYFSIHALFTKRTVQSFSVLWSARAGVRVQILRKSYWSPESDFGVRFCTFLYGPQTSVYVFVRFW